MEDAYDLLDQWDVGQNYSCWFNPYKIIDYPGTLSEDYEEYAFFKYDPDDMGGNDLTISIICFIVAGLAFISTVFGLVICYITRD
ncbi:hypothetical protein Pelo_19881 [Pelomyxa schiedti]|nr:hypothetical protein Pelo_19881 [Pelomyxa schiedti]